MGTKELAVTTPAKHGLSEERLNEAGIAAIELEHMNYEANKMARAVAASVGYELPADATDADLIQRDIRANMTRTVQACMEVGKGLLVLKTLCGHGNFTARLEVLNIENRVAQKFMASAKRFSNAALTPLLTAAGNQTKLFEMLLLDDEQLEDFELLGQSGELTLDDVSQMSVKELRSAVRALKGDADANDKLLADKSAKIDSLNRKLKKQVGVLTNWPEAFETLVTQVDHSGTRIRHHIGALEQMRLKAMQVEAAEGEEDSMEQARKIIASKLQAIIAQAQIELDAVNHSFEQTLGAWAEGEATDAASE